jgi:hypothetical protein
MIQRRDLTDREIKGQNDYADCLPKSEVERLLAEREAATAALCAGLFAKRAERLLKDMQGRLKRDPDVADFKGAFEDEVRALSPDPHYIERERLRAKGDATFECLQMSQAEILEYFDALRGQLVALPEVKQ